MKKNYLIVMLALVCNFAMAQIQQTSYRGAFAPAPTAMWTNGWANFDPINTVYSSIAPTLVTGDITSNVTWTKDKVYELTGLITVRNNATLTIQAGTVIRSNATASALVITRGAKLIANGTAAEPIVFTSKNAAGSRQRGDWGGIVMLGKARYNLNNGVNYIEGLSQNVNTEFGGGTSPIDNDNSGSLQYVRIEFAGFVFAPNNELNGLTMGAVGSGTTIDYVQVSYSNDDSFEWFGGSVNCKHLIAFNGLDDDFDTDNGYKGIVQFGLSIKDPLAADISTSECFESDNNASGSDTTSAQPYGDFTSAIFTNFTCIGANARPNGAGFVSPNSLHDKGLRLRRASQLKIFNSIFLDFKKGLVIESLSSNAAAVADVLKFKNNLIVSPAVFSTVNTTSSSTPTTANVTAWFAASGNTTFATNTSLLTRPYDLTSATNYKTITDNADTVNIDYRPSSADATTGASFTDASLSGLLTVGAAPGVISPLNYCKGVVAPALAANLTGTGVSLRWYTSETIATFSTTAPVPATTVVGSKTYYVAEVDGSGTVSNRAPIVVTIAAAPLVALGTITSTVGGVAATAAVGPYVGTTTPLTYTVPASSEGGVASYLWSVPLGVNIISGQGTNTIVVNYNNVVAGLLKIGNIAVQARNTALCGGAIKTLAITAVLPAAPSALKMTDALLPIPVSGTPTAVTSFAQYMGTNTPLVLTATPVAAASSYVWELPTGVNLVLTGAPTVTTLYYNVFPFTVGSASAPTTAGNVYYKIDKTSYSDGTSISTGRIIRIARAATGSLPAITAFNNELTNLNNEGVAINPAYPIVATTPSNVITVNFAGVTSANTFNYSTTAATPVSTNVLRIGVKARNGVGASVTANATAVNPATTSTAKLLTLKAILPKAPATLKLTNAAAVDPLLGVTIISKFVGTTTPFTLTAATSATASSYQWELPAGVTQLSGGTSNVITVDFAGVASGTTSLYLGVKGVNGIGVSATSNVLLTPATSSTAKLLKLTTSVPAVVATVAGQIAGVCGESSYNYTITPSLLATSYVVTAPAGSVVTSASNLTNTSEVLATTDLTFTVTYPAGFVASASAAKSIAIAAVNGVGTSATNKVVALSTAMPAIGIATGGTTFQRTTPQVIGVPAVLGATNYTWVAIDGAVITDGQGTNLVTVDFSAVSSSKTTNKLTVVATNACGASSAIKSITLASSTPGARMRQVALAVNVTEVYPNPVSSDFNIDVTASKAGVLEISIYSLDGTMVVSPKSVQLQEGTNTINENISSLKSGIYIVQLVNSSNNEVITKKLIKE
ncbi:T9SS type A sorting domain-containing protein [Flavobacterium franklandianum]|uniref:T9SS type A sorting domain-containing protein n=1 Tax=Flavobacterium franklandianum TaxID=2594430 RepID=UPI00117B8560|nr:T9SS type A sorting domain-containing protein [Flavobacterium franklandianum]TRX23160.1 T9SS type A sorting domain-containing protein [Flavobacterium franklandianum]